MTVFSSNFHIVLLFWCKHKNLFLTKRYFLFEKYGVKFFKVTSRVFKKLISLSKNRVRKRRDFHTVNVSIDRFALLEIVAKTSHTWRTHSRQLPNDKKCSGLVKRLGRKEKPDLISRIFIPQITKYKSLALSILAFNRAAV